MLKPKIIIEVGTETDKKAINEEFKYLLEIIGKPFKVWFDAVIIPENFEQMIRNLINDETYSAVRGRIAVQAKFVQSEYGSTLLLNPTLFTETYDTMVRFHIYLHETNHFINSLNKKDFSNLSSVDKAYMENISIFYEEYCSERFAWSICREFLGEKTQKYRDYILNCIQGHLDIISSVPQSLDNLKKVKNNLKLHKNGDRFLRDISPILEPILLSFFYFTGIQKGSPESVNKSLLELPFPFNQTPSIEMANLCHDSFPESLDSEKSLEKTKRFFSQFGYELRMNLFGFIFVNIIDD